MLTQQSNHQWCWPSSFFCFSQQRLSSSSIMQRMYSLFSSFKQYICPMLFTISLILSLSFTLIRMLCLPMVNTIWNNSTGFSFTLLRNLGAEFFLFNLPTEGCLHILYYKFSFISLFFLQPFFIRSMALSQPFTSLAVSLDLLITRDLSSRLGLKEHQFSYAQSLYFSIFFLSSSLCLYFSQLQRRVMSPFSYEGVRFQLVVQKWEVLAIEVPELDRLFLPTVVLVPLRLRFNLALSSLFWKDFSRV